MLPGRTSVLCGFSFPTGIPGHMENPEESVAHIRQLLLKAAPTPSPPGHTSWGLCTPGVACQTSLSVSALPSMCCHSPFWFLSF